MSLNTEELKHYEVAARLYCEHTGMPPDTKMPRPHPEIAGIILTVPAWHVAAEELFDLSIKLAVLKQAALAKKAAEEKSAGANDA